MARTKPLPRSERILRGREINRGIERTRKTDDVKNINIGLMDVDSAIMYYFTQVIKPSVKDNGEEVKVPVLYANAERWASIQRRGNIRDKNNQLITPAIVFKRTSISRDDSIAIDSVDANDPKNFYFFQQKYSKENRYDQFSAKNNLMPTKEFYQVAVPKYITMNYEAIIFTTLIEQMNSIVEKINWSGGSYWGEPNKFKFKANIESFEDATEMVDNERMIKTTFSFNFRGYLIPESFNEFINTQKYLTPKQIVTEGEFEFGVSSVFSPDSRTERVRVFSNRSSTLNSLGGSTDFIRPISPGYGNAAQDLEFTNTFGGDTFYVMRGGGSPTSSKDDKAVVSLSSGNGIYMNKTQFFSGSQSSSAMITGSSSGSVFQPTFDSGFVIQTGSLDLQVNGVNLLSEQTNQKDITNTFDFFISSSLKDIVIFAQRSGSGITLKEDDKIIMNFQQALE